MLKYVDYSVVFQEVPGEVSLAFTISNCQGRCDGCHSPHLRGDIGYDLEKDLRPFLEKYNGLITCVLFLGEGNDPQALWNCIEIAAEYGKVALYSGKETLEEFMNVCDYYSGALSYLKVGSYKAEFGPLTSPTTNQRFYAITGFTSAGIQARDDTWKFWRKNNEDSSEPGSCHEGCC